MLREIFKKVKANSGVTGKAISQHTGISENHISEYLRGKRDVTSATLDRMIDAMDELSPGAKKYFGDSISGRILNQAIEDLEDERLGELVVRASDELARRLIDKSRKNTLASDRLEVKAW